MAEKAYRHFKDEESLFRILGEIRKRIQSGYGDLAEQMCREIKAYFARIPDVIDDSGESLRPKLLVGLSGGVDSSVVVYLAAGTVGGENVLPITLPARGDDECLYYSQRVREDLEMEEGPVQHVISIEEIVEKEIDVINRLQWKGMAIRTSPGEQGHMDRMRVGNFASRARISVLYDIARKMNGRVLGTGNRTEFVQGYAAKYGTPISFDFGVLDDLYKVDVYELARVLNVPEEIIARVPTTGYFPGQTHEEELGATWEEQDALAYLLFERNMGGEEISLEYGVKEAFVETMIRRYRRNRDKRMLRQPHIRLGHIRDGNT